MHGDSHYDESQDQKEKINYKAAFRMLYGLMRPEKRGNRTASPDPSLIAPLAQVWMGESVISAPATSRVTGSGSRRSSFGASNSRRSCCAVSQTPVRIDCRISIPCRRPSTQIGQRQRR